MSVAEDIYKTLKGSSGLQDQMKRIEKNLGDVSTEPRNRRSRHIRLATTMEVYERLSQRRLPKPREVRVLSTGTQGGFQNGFQLWPVKNK